MPSPVITELVATPATAAARESGLLFHLRFVVDQHLAVDGATVRRARGGQRVYVAFPSRRDAHGIERFHVRPTAAARREIEAAILTQLGLGVTE